MSASSGSRKASYMSTTNRQFTTGGRKFSTSPTNSGRSGVSMKGLLGKEEDEENDDFVDDVDKKGQKRKGKVRVISTRTEGSAAIIDESPNGYHIVADAPKEPKAAEEYFLSKASEYALLHQEEWALCKFYATLSRMGRIEKDRTVRIKMIDKSMGDLADAAKGFSMKQFPVMYAVILTLRAQLCREKALETTTKDYVSHKGAAAAHLRLGLKATEAALGPLTAVYPGYSDEDRLVEQAILRLETGWLSLLRLQDEEEKSDLDFEMAIGYLERALGLFERWNEIFQERSGILSDGGKKTWDDAQMWIPDDPSTHPAHIRAMLRGRPLKAAHGACLCLLGIGYMDWRDDPEGSLIAFEYLSTAVKPSYLTKENSLWVIAHHHLAKLILRDPRLVNNSRGISGAMHPTVHVDAVIFHLSQALTSPACEKWNYELKFRLALAHLLKLYGVTDKLQSTSSIAAAIMAPQNIETLRTIESNLTQALKGVTAGNKGGIEAFVFYFSSLKMAELKILQSVAIDNFLRNKIRNFRIPVTDRKVLLKDAMKYIMETLWSRPCEENIDLNYLAVAQVCFLLSSSRKYELALRCYARSLMSISCMMNRLRFIFGSNNILSARDERALGVGKGGSDFSALAPDEEAIRNACFALVCTAKVVDWVDCPGYSLGTKIDNGETNVSKLLLVTSKEGGLQTVKKIWIFESNNFTMTKVIKEKPIIIPKAPPSAGNKGEGQFVKKPRLATIVQASGEAGNPAEDDDEEEETAVPQLMPVNETAVANKASEQAKVRTYANLFQRLQHFFARKRETTEKKIIATSQEGVSSAFGFTKKMTSALKINNGPVELPTMIISSQQAFFALTVLSRLSRILLMKAAFDLGASKGERARYLLCGIGPDGLTRGKDTGIPQQQFHELKQIQKDLLASCVHSPIPPGSIRDLSVRPQKDINELFRNQMKITKLLEVEEHFLFDEISKHDYFLPLITSSPVFTNEITAFDKEIFDESSILALDTSKAGGTMEEEQDGDDGDGDVDTTERGDAGTVVTASEVASSTMSRSGGPRRAYRTSSMYRDVATDKVHTIEINVSNNRRTPRGLPTIDKPDNLKVDEAYRFAYEDVDKLIPKLSAAIDGSLTSIREVLMEDLKPNDIMLIWHMSSSKLGGNHALQVLVAWWDIKVDEDQEPVSAKKKPSKKGDIVIELARSETDAARVSYALQTLVDSLNARTPALRASMSIDAVRALSLCFALGEVIRMAPTNCNNIVICCPPFLRLVPWSAMQINVPIELVPPKPSTKKEEAGSSKGAPSILDTSLEEGSIEDDSSLEAAEGEIKMEGGDEDPSVDEPVKPSQIIQKKRAKDLAGPAKQEEMVAIDIVDRYSVHLGPTLSLFELCCNKLKTLETSMSSYNMCFVNGDNKISAVKGASTETDITEKLWSVATWDTTILQEQDACLSTLTTRLKKPQSNDDHYDDGAEDESKKSSLASVGGLITSLKRVSVSGRLSNAGGRLSDASGGQRTPSGSDSEGDSSDGESEKPSAASSGKKSLFSRMSIGIISSKNKSAKKSGKVKTKKRGYNDNALTLLSCRVLHMCASKVIVPNALPTTTNLLESDAPQRGHNFGKKQMVPAMSLPVPTDRKDAKTMLTAKDVVSQMYLKNCNLCVLSRFGIIDGNVDVPSLQGEWDYIDGLHLAGATTVLFPLWGGSGTISGMHLSRALFLMRFYFELPLHAASDRAVAEACRQAQLWLRSCSILEIKYFIMNSQLDQAVRVELLEELIFFASTVGITTTTAIVECYEETLKLFSHVLYWSPFVISGTACDIHPRNMNDLNKKEDNASSGSKFSMASMFSGKKSLFGRSAKIFSSKEEESPDDLGVDGSATGAGSRPSSAEAKNIENELKRRRTNAAEEAKRRITIAQKAFAPPPKPVNDPNKRKRNQQIAEQPPPPNLKPENSNEGKDASKESKDDKTAPGAPGSQPNSSTQPGASASQDTVEDGITGVAPPELAAKLGLTVDTAALDALGSPEQSKGSIRLAPLLYKGRPPRTAAERMAAVRAQTRNVEAGAVPPSPDAMHKAIARRQLRHGPPPSAEEEQPSETVEVEAPVTEPAPKDVKPQSKSATSTK